MRRIFCLAALFFISFSSFFLVTAEDDSTSLRVAIYDEAPYQFLDEEGFATGLLVDVFTAAAERSGYKTEYIFMERLTQCVQALYNGEVDVILGMPSCNNYNLNESIELYSSEMVLVGAEYQLSRISDPSQNLSIGYDFHTITDSILYRLNSNHYVVSSRQNALLEYQQNGHADVVIVDQLIAKWFFRQPQTTQQETLKDSVASIRYTIAVSESSRALLRNLNTGLLEFRLSGDYTDIVDHWTVFTPTQQLLSFLRLAIVILILFALAAAGWIIIELKIHKMLALEVKTKTLELQQANETLAQKYDELQYYNDLRRQIIESSTNGMVLTDREFHVQIMNGTACRLAQVPENSYDLTLTALPRFSDFIKLIDQKLFELPSAAKTLTFSLESSDGQKETFIGSANTVICNNEIIGALFSLEDITLEMQVAQRNFEREKNKTLNRMIAGIAHEIKNPLMSIRTYASLINQKIDDLAFRNSFAEFVPRESDRINHLVESLVNYAKPVQGERTYTDLFAIVRDCAYLSGVAKRNRNVHFDLLAEGHCTIYANANQIQQVLVNVIINSIESIEKKLSKTDHPAPLSLCIRAFIEEDLAIVDVTDQGIGMNEQVRQHCTEFFYSTKQNGSGLGLALCNLYVEDNEGQMEITSIEGQYTRVRLKFRRITNETDSTYYR